MIVNILNLIFTIYTLMLCGRIIGSWFLNVRQNKIMQFLYYYTEPYLRIFRKIIPPLGGMVDFSPLLGFLVLKLLQTFLLNLMR